MHEEIEIVEEPGRMTTISIPVKLVAMLRELKIVPQESYYSVIFRLVELQSKD